MNTRLAAKQSENDILNIRIQMDRKDRLKIGLNREAAKDGYVKVE